MNSREDQHWGCGGNTSWVASWQFDGHAPHIFSEWRNSSFLLYFFEPPNFENMCFVGGFYYRRSQNICEFLWVSHFMKQLEKKSPFYPTCRQSDPQKRWCYWSISPSWWLIIDPTPNAKALILIGRAHIKHPWTPSSAEARHQLVRLKALVCQSWIPPRIVTEIYMISRFVLGK